MQGSGGGQPQGFNPLNMGNAKNVNTNRSVEGNQSHETPMQTPMAKMTLSPKANRGTELSAQPGTSLESTIEHKPMTRLKNKMNAVGSVGETAGFPQLEE